MAPSAESHQIFLSVVPQQTPRLYVMDLQIHRTSAQLASPSISDQNLSLKLGVGLTVQP